MGTNRVRNEPNTTSTPKSEANTEPSDNLSHSIAIDGKSGSQRSTGCYTLDEFEEKLGVDFGEKVQFNTDVSKRLREFVNEFSHRLGSSTCEFVEAVLFSLYAADHGLKDFLILTRQINLTVQPLVVRVVKKRRRRLPQNSDAVVVLPTHGDRGICHNCGSRFGVNKWLAHEALVYLCATCAKIWLRSERLRVLS